MGLCLYSTPCLRFRAYVFDFLWPGCGWLSASWKVGRRAQRKRRKDNRTRSKAVDEEQNGVGSGSFSALSVVEVGGSDIKARLRLAHLAAT
jgi:hypothetical protein